jgi:biotin carboxylase
VDVELVVADRDPEAAGFALADERVLISTEDEHALERLARARGVAGIVSPGADWPVGVAARIAERLGLPHPIDAATASLATSKLRQRERFAAAGVPHARALDARDVVFPCVVKAPDRQGQRGLTLVERRDQLGPALERARSASRSGAVLVEELVEGPEVTVIGLVLDGEHVSLAVTDRLTADPPAFGVALAHVWPSRHPVEPAVDAAGAAAAALGIRSGPTYTQVRLGPEGPRVMELAARLGGGHDAELVEAVTGVDLNELAVRFALGEPTPDVTSQLGQTREHIRRAGCVVFLVPPVGTLREVRGVSEAEAIEGVRWVRVYRRRDRRLGPLLRGSDRAGAALAVGASREEALERGHRARDAVRFEVDADAP